MDVWTIMPFNFGGNGGGADTCGGIPQEPWEFTSILARYQG
ncbi:hypothetical protein [Streptomyces sp. NPDC004134]